MAGDHSHGRSCDTASIALALALPPDLAGEPIYETAHLKWRTLPVAIRLAGPDDVTEAVSELIDEAIEYAPHSRPQPIERFYRHRRRGRYGGPDE